MTLSKAIMLFCALAISSMRVEAAEPVLDRSAWSADFDQLLDALSARYANLEWSAERGMDLPGAVRRTRSRIEAATNEYEARLALERFVRSFGDGHLELSWPSGPTPVREKPAPAARPVCTDLGFTTPSDDHALGPRMPGYVPLDTNLASAAGTFISGGRKIAVLRIERFAPTAPECEQALVERRIAPEGPCDEACGKQIAERAELLFVENMERRVRALSRLKPDLLLIDVTRNGGGNDSAIAMARMLGGDLPSPRVARVRDPALARNIADKRESLRPALNKVSANDRADLTRTLAALDRAEAESVRTCDRSPLWDGRSINCTALVRGPFYAGGLLERPLSSNLDGDARDVAYAAARYTYTPGYWEGPLAVAADGDTASSAELFTAMLQDARRAIIVGSPTIGAGCGWMLPVRPVVLPHSKAQLRMPDCVRYRADGSNEVDAVRPDVAAHVRQSDSPKQRAARILAVLPRVVEAARVTP